MKLATTTEDFRKFCKTYKEQVENVCEAGFKYIDLGMYVVDNDDSLLIRDDWKKCAEELKITADKYGAKFIQAHSPGGNPLKEEGFEKLLKVTLRSIEVCGELGIKNIVVHAGLLPEIGKEEFFKLNKQYYQKLFPTAEKCGVNILCENGTAKNAGTMYHTNSGEDMAEFVKYVNHPLFHICWDTGHANCEGNQCDDIKTLGKELYALHINDNRGGGDEHIIPYFGTVNMDEIMTALIDIGYSGYFTFESGSTLRPAKYWQGNRRAFEKDTRLSEPQLFMQKQVEKLMYDIGEYILKAYNCFEK